MRICTCRNTRDTSGRVAQLRRVPIAEMNMGCNVGTCWPPKVWLRGAAGGENSGLDFSSELVVGSESLEGLVLVVVVVLARRHQINVLTGQGEVWGKGQTGMRAGTAAPLLQQPASPRQSKGRGTWDTESVPGLPVCVRSSAPRAVPPQWEAPRRGWDTHRGS